MQIILDMIFLKSQIISPWYGSASFRQSRCNTCVVFSSNYLVGFNCYTKFRIETRTSAAMTIETTVSSTVEAPCFHCENTRDRFPFAWLYSISSFSCNRDLLIKPDCQIIGPRIMRPCTFNSPCYLCMSPPSAFSEIKRHPQKNMPFCGLQCKTSRCDHRCNCRSLSEPHWLFGRRRSRVSVALSQTSTNPRSTSQYLLFTRSPS